MKNNLFKLRKQHAVYVDDILKNGHTDRICIGSALTLMRASKHDAKDCFQVKPLAQDHFYGFIGKQQFKKHCETEEYTYYKKSGKSWKELV